MGQTLKFTGRQISPNIISKIWEETRSELGTEYAVKEIQMPKIDGIVLSYKRFVQADRKLKASSHIENLTKAEWGVDEVGVPSAGVFYSDVDKKWMLLKLKGANPLEVDVKHELLHIWESILKVPWGTLTRKLATK